MRNHLRNTEEALTLNISQMFPRLCTQATYFEDAEFASRKQKCFAIDNDVIILRNLAKKTVKRVYFKIAPVS